MRRGSRRSGGQSPGFDASLSGLGIHTFKLLHRRRRAIIIISRYIHTVVERKGVRKRIRQRTHQHHHCRGRVSAFISSRVCCIDCIACTCGCWRLLAASLPPMHRSAVFPLFFSLLFFPLARFFFLPASFPLSRFLLHNSAPPPPPHPPHPHPYPFPSTPSSPSGPPGLALPISTPATATLALCTRLTHQGSPAKSPQTHRVPVQDGVPFLSQASDRPLPPAFSAWPDPLYCVLAHSRSSLSTLLLSRPLFPSCLPPKPNRTRSPSRPCAHGSRTLCLVRACTLTLPHLLRTSAHNARRRQTQDKTSSTGAQDEVHTYRLHPGHGSTGILEPNIGQVDVRTLLLHTTTVVL